MLTLVTLLVLTTFVCVIVSALGKCALWVPVLLLTLIELIQVVPIK